MAHAVLPPELRSICRRLATAKTEQLPHLLPALLRDLSRCQEPLSISYETRTGQARSEAAILVHKLKTQISAVLNGRTVQGRFVAVALVKAAIEAGGWECLRTSGPWITALLSILQKRDPYVTKELCIVTLTKVYTMLNAYPTLIRELVTPTLPTFGDSCLQILKPPASSKAAKAPCSLVETILEAFSVLMFSYPTTLRPHVARLKLAIRPYIVPTSSDAEFVPASLRESSRRLFVRFHMTAARSGGSDEWANTIGNLIKDLHATADQVFRSILESWESSSGYVPQTVAFDVEVHGGGDPPDQLPPWTGVQAGGERIVGLLNLITDCLRCRTKSAVTIPISAITDAITRISSILPPSAGKDKPDESVQMRAEVGRDEKDELWAMFPSVQVASMQLCSTMIRRLGPNYIPMAQETLDHTLRMFQSGYRLPEMRTVAFRLVQEILLLCGPTLSKTSVESLTLVIKTCCRDFLGAAGRLRKPQQQAASKLQNGARPQSVTQNADAFLSSKTEDETLSVPLNAEHKSAAEELLTTLFSHLPQHHLSSSLRSTMLRTAILTQKKHAQIASVLHPYRDVTGRTPHVILPYLNRQFPHDEDVELLRFNFRPFSTQTEDPFPDEEMDIIEESLHEPSLNGNSGPNELSTSEGGVNSEGIVKFGDPLFPVPQVASMADASPDTRKQPLDSPPTTSAASLGPDPAVPDVAVAGEVAGWPEPDSLKRKNDEQPDVVVSKRIELDIAENQKTGESRSFPSTGIPATAERKDEADDYDDSDDESVHLNMELDSDNDSVESEERQLE